MDEGDVGIEPQDLLDEALRGKGGYLFILLFRLVCCCGRENMDMQACRHDLLGDKQALDKGQRGG